MTGRRLARRAVCAALGAACIAALLFFLSITRVHEPLLELYLVVVVLVLAAACML